MSKYVNKSIAKLTIERLKEMLDYQPKTGNFIWKTTNRTIKSGKIAGNISKRGYISIQIDGAQYQGHRLAWYYFYKTWPSVKIDHKDRNPSNNRISNLREATDRQNVANSKANSNSKTNIKGVTLLSGRSKPYRSSIRIGKNRIFLGYFKTAEEASVAYQRAAETLHGEFAYHTNNKP